MFLFLLSIASSLSLSFSVYSNYHFIMLCMHNSFLELLRLLIVFSHSFHSLFWEIGLVLSAVHTPLSSLTCTIFTSSLGESLSSQIRLLWRLDADASSTSLNLSHWIYRHCNTKICLFICAFLSIFKIGFVFGFARFRRRHRYLCYWQWKFANSTQWNLYLWIHTAVQGKKKENRRKKWISWKIESLCVVSSN